MDSFDRWLEFELQEQLRPAYSLPASPAQARYRQSLLARGFGRRSKAIAKLAPVMAAILALGTVGAEAAGYGPVHVGKSGLYVKIGTVPATPNPPVIPPLPTPEATQPGAAPAPTSERQDLSPGESAAPRESAQPSETPERQVSSSGSSEVENQGAPASSGSPEPGDH